MNVTGVSACLYCPTGTIADETKSTTCRACAPGSSTATLGAVICNNCSVGSYQKVFGQTSCVSCNAGFLVPSFGQTACQACEPGFANDQKEADLCYSCSSGMYSSLYNQTSLSRFWSTRSDVEHRRWPCFRRHGATHRVSLNLGTFASVSSPHGRRFQPSVHPQSQGHPEHRPEGIFCRGAASIVVPGILAWVCSGGLSAASESERGQVVAVSNIWTDCVTGFSHRCDPVSGGRRCVGRSPHERCDWFSVCSPHCRRFQPSVRNERWTCRETHPVGTPFRTFDHGGTTYYHASRNCSQACLDDDACISYDFVVGSQADSCKFHSGQRCRRTAQRKPATGTAAPL